MFSAVVSLVRKPLEFVGILSEPEWVMTEEERELVRSVREHFREPVNVYKDRQGLVTSKSSNAIQLAHRYLYRLTEDQDYFEVGDFVAWKEYKTDQGIEIKDVVKVTEKCKFEDRSVNGEKVVIVDGPKCVTDHGYLFYLDKVQCDAGYSPDLLDFVNLSGVYPKNDEEFDPDPLEFVVKRVSPARSRLITGKITSWDPATSTGIVNNEVVFHTRVCKLSPVLGASVACDCVEYGGNHDWRAYEVTHHERRMTNSHHFFLVDSVPHFNVVLGETKTVEFFVHNNSNDRPCKIENISFYSAGQPMDVNHGLRLPCTMIPQTTISCPVQVIGDKLGRRTIKIQWKIAHKLHPITSSYVYSVVQHTLEGPVLERAPARPQLIVSGQRMVRRPVFRRVHMKDYAVPEKLREICTERSTGGFDDLIATRMALQQERPALAGGLHAAVYSEWMHILLFIEEICDERFYEGLATTASLYSGRDCITFNFPADSPYSKIVVGDTVYASKPWEGIKYEAKVWTISSTQLSLKFHGDFESSIRSGALYKLEFRLNRNSSRRRHQAVDLVLQNLGAEWLFPNEHNSATPDSQPTVQWFNQELNVEQKNAVKNILAKNNLPYPYVIYGPPGTGKTVTVVEAILQIITVEPDCRILVTAPTNSAVDQLGLRLLDYGVFDKSELVRLSSYKAYSSGIIAAQLIDVSRVPSLGDPAFDSLISRDSENIPTMHLDDLYQHKITIGTLSTVSHFNCVGVSKGYFSHIIIDEAGQCTEPDSLLPIALVQPDKTQLVLAGDPMQLGPVVSSPLAKEYSLHRSFLDRLTAAYLYRKKDNNFRDTLGYNPTLITRLVSNYRSLPKIVNVIGSIFYGNDLRSTVPVSGSREAQVLESITLHKVALKDNNDSMIFINLNTPENQMDGSMSWFNDGEVLQVVSVINYLNLAGVSPDDIGVITPYALQVKKIYEHLDSRGIISPKVGSVEEFQGQERDIIIVSLVRNNLGVAKRVSGFISEPQRVNVALSRARVLNIIIGNKNTLYYNPLWKQIIDQCRFIDLVPHRPSASQA